MEVPAGLIAQLSPGGATTIGVVAPWLDPRDIPNLVGLADWDRVLLLVRPEILGPDGLQRFLDRVIGKTSCCADCAGKDTPAKRRQARSALNLLRRHLRRNDGSLDAVRVAAVVNDLRSLFVAGL